jgi:hypothetical protein
VEGDLLCPNCQAALEGGLSSVCQSCGLLWVDATNREMVRGQPLSDEAPKAWRLVLREFPPLWRVVVLICFMCMAYGAAWAALWNVIASPSGWLGWAALIVGVLLGGFVGTFALAGLMQSVLRSVFPTYLELDGNQHVVRMNAWNTWEGAMSGFRRVKAMLPYNQLEGFALLTGQGGESQFFLLHRSGLACGTGWSGTRPKATELGKSLMHRLSLKTPAPDGQLDAPTAVRSSSIEPHCR